MRKRAAERPTIGGIMEHSDLYNFVVPSAEQVFIMKDVFVSSFFLSLYIFSFLMLLAIVIILLQAIWNFLKIIPKRLKALRSHFKKDR